MSLRLVHRRHFPVDHYVLIDPDASLSPGRLIAHARLHAERLALHCTGDASCFTLIHNGAGLARRELPHVHIVCARSRFQKALVYLLIGLKNLLPSNRPRRG